MFIQNIYLDLNIHFENLFYPLITTYTIECLVRKRVYS